MDGGIGDQQDSMSIDLNTPAKEEVLSLDASDDRKDETERSEYLEVDVNNPEDLQRIGY